jgi:hypothetical protein
MRFARRVSFRLSLQLSQQCSVLGLFAPRQSRVQIRTMRLQGLQPAARVSNQKKDVWFVLYLILLFLGRDDGCSELMMGL